MRGNDQTASSALSAPGRGAPHWSGCSRRCGRGVSGIVTLRRDELLQVGGTDPNRIGHPDVGAARRPRRAGRPSTRGPPVAPRPPSLAATGTGHPSTTPSRPSWASWLRVARFRARRGATRAPRRFARRRRLDSVALPACNGSASLRRISTPSDGPPSRFGTERSEVRILSPRKLQIRVEPLHRFRGETGAQGPLRGGVSE
jgi:hypothetical protein